jgi:hypothetical protein
VLLLFAGAVFKRKKYVLGLSTGTEQILMKLSSDEQRYHDIMATALQLGECHCTTRRTMQMMMCLPCFFALGSLLWRVHESQKQLTRIDLHDVNLIETSGTYISLYVCISFCPMLVLSARFAAYP